MSAPFLTVPIFSWPAAPGGLVYTYVAGSTTPKVTFSDPAGTNANPNPVRLDSTGSAIIRLDTGSYEIVLKDSTGTTTLWDAPYVDSAFLTADAVGSLIFPISEAEGNASITPIHLGYAYDDIRRYITANDPLASTANTAMLIALFQPTVTNGPTGIFKFVNAGGSDIYYVNDVVCLRAAVIWDLCGSTYNFVKTTTDAHDTNAGAIFGVRDNQIYNGTLAINYTGTGDISAMRFGARDDEMGAGAFFPGSYDVGMPIPQGNCVARNLRISVNNANSYAVSLSGGLRTASVHDITFDGGGVAPGCVYYEFGFGTNGSGVASARVSSHAYNLSIRNIDANNLPGGTVVTLIGAYNYLVENIYGNGAATVIYAAAGEAMYYQVQPQDLAGKKCTKSFRNIVGQNLTSHGINFQGTEVAAGTYLGAGGGEGPVVIGNPPLTTAQVLAAEKNLGIFSLDGFALSGSPAGTGILVSGRAQEIKNGACSGFNNGFAAYDESGTIIMDQCIAEGNVGPGFNFAIGNNNSDSPTYLTKKISMRACIAVNNSTGTTGASPGFNFGNCDSATVEDCRSNAEATIGYDVADEATQGNAYQLGLNAQNVVFRNCRAGVMVGSNHAYANVVNPGGGTLGATNGNNVINPSGITTQKGAWVNLLAAASPDRGDATVGLTQFSDYFYQQFRTPLTADRNVNIAAATAGPGFRISRYDTAAHALVVVANSATLHTFGSGAAGWVDVLPAAAGWIVTAAGTVVA